MAASKSDTAFLGHPSGLGWLSFSEFWERFSYYSMQALLVLYLTHSLFLPGHIEHVLGIDALRHLIQLFYRAPLTSEQLASNINGNLYRHRLPHAALRRTDRRPPHRPHLGW